MMPTGGSASARRPPSSNVSATIRAIKHGDIDAVLLLFDAVANERLWIGTEPGYDREKYRDIFGRAASGGNGMFVAETPDGEIVGMLSSYDHAEYGWMLGMMIDARYRGAGIGKALLDALCGWARARAIAQLSLLVFPHNERALRLYRGAGFVEIERFPADVTRKDGAVWDTILMRKTL